MIIHQIQEFCRGILEACDRVNANESVIQPQIISKVLEVCTAILENIPQQRQREFAKRLDLQRYTINSDSTKTTGSTEDKSTTERTITISETLSEKFQSWKASPETLFEQSSLSLNQGLYAYIDLAEEADAVKDIRLRFTKWIFYRCRESWGHNGKRKFFQRLRNDGTDVDERKCSRWLHEGKAYDVFVTMWGIGVLLIIPVTSTEAERFPLTETSNNGRNNKREAALNNLEVRGIKQAADTCHEVSKALASHLLNDEKLVSLFNKGTYPTILTLERKPPQRPTTTVIQQLKKKRKRTDAEDTGTSLGGSSEQTSGPGATISQPFPTTSVSDDDEGRPHLRRTASQEPRTAEATGLPTPLDIRDLQTGALANSIPLPERDYGGEIPNQADRFGQRRLSQVTPTNRAEHGRSSPLQNASLDTGSMTSSSSATIESTISQHIKHSASNGLSVQSTFNNSRANQTPSRSDIKNSH
ncbi:hypothetical protein AK830_g5487 [Neonectria ditissima]|uniref:Uncharacterized protein n=1 Tax=Neonectria ditissima TaxID=78410 RepID=A0A0P7B4U8_9HYPO|nr:hypothetical protein AK830_g5487 [Neonectria ditissima]